MGGPVHTKYNNQLLPIEVEVVRCHHPLLGQKLPVVRACRTFFVVRLADESHMKILKIWTNIDSNLAVDPLRQDTIFTKTSILELLDLVQILCRR